MMAVSLYIVILSISYIRYTHSQLVNCTTDVCDCPNSLITGEKCILNCDKEDSCKSSTLYCRAGDPCEIRCIAKSACAQDTEIKGATATHVSLICNGEDTCKSSTILHCGTGDCTMSCHGKASCEEFGEINSSSSSSFQCSGNCPPDIITFTTSPTVSLPTSPTIPTSTPSPAPVTSTTIPPSSDSAQTITETSIITVSPSSNINENLFVIDLDDIHPLYYVIALLLVLIFVVCFALFCWIYLSHHRTQKLIKEQQARLDSGSLEFRNTVSAFKSGENTHHNLHNLHNIHDHHHNVVLVSPTPTVDAYALPKKYKMRKDEGDEPSDSETSVTDSRRSNLSSNILSNEIWNISEDKDGDNTTHTITTTAHNPYPVFVTCSKCARFTSHKGYPPYPTETTQSELSHCSESYAINDSIVRHMDTVDMDAGETYDDSMIAVRHSTMSSEPYDVETPMFHIQIKTADEWDIHSTSDRMLQPPHIAVKDIKNDAMQNILILQKRLVVDIPEIPEEFSKSFKSRSIEHSKDCFAEDSNVDLNEFDRNSYAIQLVAVDEPTLTDFKSQSKTISTVVEDTYLKYLQ